MHFSPTYHAMYTFIFQFPFEHYRLNIFFDNLFTTTIPLFRYLHFHGIEVAETSSSGRLEFPEELTLVKGIAKIVMESNYLSAVVVNNVCTVL